MAAKNPSRYEDVRCEAFTHEEWHKESHRCVNKQHFAINGKLLCCRHAMMEALYIAFRNGKAKLLTRPRDVPSSVAIEAQRRKGNELRLQNLRHD